MRRVGLFLVVGLIGPLVMAASASAQTSVILSPSTASAGTTITATGSGFSNAGGADIRLTTRDGALLKGDIVVDSRGRFTTQFPLPGSVSPGLYLAIAVQVTEFGRQRGFTPARAKLRVVAAAGTGAPPGGSPGAGPPIALLASLALLLVLAGGTLTLRRLRTTAGPELAGHNAASSR